MKKQIYLIMLASLFCTNIFSAVCPDCSNVTFTTVNATGFGCNGELFINFNTSCPAQVQITGLDYNGAPYNNIVAIFAPYGHWYLKAGSYSFQFTSYDGFTQECSTAFIPFTILQPICDYDLQHSFGTPDYCAGTIPVSVWSNNQGCSSEVDSTHYRMVIEGFTSYDHQPVVFDVPLGFTDLYDIYNYDNTGGSLENVCKDTVTITAPDCDFIISLTSVAGTQCDNHKIIVTATGNKCSGQWQADLMKDGIYDTTLFSITNQIQFTNLSNGNYEVIGNTGVCYNSKLKTLNLCPKPFNTTTTSITTTSAKTKWKVKSCGVGYQVAYRVQGTTAWTIKSVTTNVGHKNLTGLTPLTIYEWKVRTKCQPGVFSGYSIVNTFTTLTAREGNDAIDISTDEEFISEIILAPNPAQQNILLSFETDAGYADVQIINVAGQSMLEQKLNSDDGFYQESFDVSRFPAGMYLMMIRTENGMETRRFLKEN